MQVIARILQVLIFDYQRIANSQTFITTGGGLEGGI